MGSKFNRERTFIVEAIYPCDKTEYVDMVNTYDDYKNRIKHINNHFSIPKPR